MPLAAYFRNVGAALLALLWILDFYLPGSTGVQRSSADPPVIRIHSDRKWPERLVFDTTQVSIAAAAPGPWDMNPPAPPAAREMPTDAARKSGTHNALARTSSRDSRRVASVEHRKRQVTARYVARSARRYPTQQVLLAARQGQFAWFGFGY